MNFLKPHSIEDLIIHFLLKREKPATALLIDVQTVRKTTKQGLYAALRKLKEDEIVLIYKGVVSINTVWIKKMKDAFNALGRTYTTEQDSFDVLNLQDKESIVYSFSSIKNLDTFWGHSQNILMYNTNASEPIYAYDPHYWFYIARKETEQTLLKEITQNKRQFFMAVGGNFPLDKVIQRDFNNDFLQYSYNKIFPKENYYITVIGDYISEVFIDEGTAKKIEELYRSNKTIDTHVINSFYSLLSVKVKSKIKISKNKARAEKLKKKMGKDFYILKK